MRWGEVKETVKVQPQDWLGKPLGGIGARTYHVSGPWKEPKVEVVERDAGPGPAGTPGDAQAPDRDPGVPAADTAPER